MTGSGRVPTSKATGITYDSEAEFFERYYSPDKKEEPYSPLGDALSRAMKFEHIKGRLRRLIEAGESDKVICKELGLDKDELSRFKEKLRKSSTTKSLVSDKIRNREVSLEEFLEEAEGDVDILSWQSYYGVLKFAEKELCQVRHVKDQYLGILIDPEDVKPLIRKALRRMLPVKVLNCIRDKRLIPVVLKTNKEDSKAFRRKLSGKVRMRDVVICQDAISICQRYVKETSKDDDDE